MSYTVVHPTTMLRYKLVADAETQHAEYVCKEEYFHKDQYCHEVGWDQGGININKPGRFNSLNGLHKEVCATPKEGEGAEEALRRACAAADVALEELVVDKWFPIVRSFADKLESQPYRCWVEYTAKKAVGLLHNTVAGYHYECTYPNCNGVISKPPEP
jgi:hypothetical protein